ncbi:MAG: hypothetical protein ABI358_13310 [Ginsengibacter sp.]
MKIFLKNNLSNLLLLLAFFALIFTSCDSSKRAARRDGHNSGVNNSHYKGY